MARPYIARLATADRNGHPHVVPVWFGWDGESIWISSFAITRKVNELMQNPWVSIAVDVGHETGQTRAVILEGRAVLVSEPRELVRQQSTWIYTRYLGEAGVLEKEPQSWIADPENLLIKLTPERAFAWSY
ncbi:MAG TPA: pyridoxamine 5'-phosphate oxidase family protein [Anaerolineaceae bacterium]|nr:pyridoxamine 5'-phosphate oxidase family protein [Anaerolineaceae bacterium]